MEVEGLNVNFGHSCNNNCIHCLIGQEMRTKYRDRTTEEIKELLLEASKKTNYTIFIGGEATLRRDFLELLEFAKSLGLNIHLETNGRMFSIKSFARRVFQIDPNLDIVMSFHHTCPNIQDKITGVKGSFKQSVKGMENIRKFGKGGDGELGVICVITKLNYKNLSELVTFLNSKSIDQLDFTLMRIGGDALENFDKIFVPIKEIQPYLFEAIKKSRKLDIRTKTYGFPFCTIKGYEKYAVEVGFIESLIKKKKFVFWELNERIEWHKTRLEIKTKLSRCLDCKYYNICEGLWKEYMLLEPEILKPIKGRRLKSQKETSKLLGK